jgi:hypothetical protein
MRLPSKLLLASEQVALEFAQEDPSFRARRDLSRRYKGRSSSAILQGSHIVSQEDGRERGAHATRIHQSPAAPRHATPPHVSGPFVRTRDRPRPPPDMLIYINLYTTPSAHPGIWQDATLWAPKAQPPLKSLHPAPNHPPAPYTRASHAYYTWLHRPTAESLVENTGLGYGLVRRGGGAGGRESGELAWATAATGASLWHGGDTCSSSERPERADSPPQATDPDPRSPTAPCSRTPHRRGRSPAASGPRTVTARPMRIRPVEGFGGGCQAGPWQSREPCQTGCWYMTECGAKVTTD